MTVSKDTLLRALPPYQDDWVMIKEKQEVPDIIVELEEAYPEFADYYDRIGHFFEGASIEQTCDNLYEFCKKNIRYSEEPEAVQTSALPTGILTRGFGDCKAYASFIGGCLGAIGRETGRPIDWEFCFVSYLLWQKTPYHVFVVVHTDKGDIWVDPTPGADGASPVWQVLRRVDTVPKIAGIDAGGHMLFEQRMVGAGSTGTLPPTALPLPDGYPAGLPSPYLDGGKIKFTPVPPNFTPTNEQLAWMLIALQLWVYTYSPAPYNVFTYNSHYDGSGLSIADYLVRYMQYYRNPDSFYNGAYGWWVDVPAVINKGIVTVPAYRKFVPRELYAGNQPGVYLSPNDPKGYQTAALFGQQVEEIDFGAPPPPAAHSWIDDVGAIAKVVNQYVMRYVTQLIPVVGTLFANAWNKAMNQGAIDEAGMQAGINAEIKKIVENPSASTGTNDNMKYVIIAAALLALWWYYDE